MEKSKIDINMHRLLGGIGSILVILTPLMFLLGVVGLILVGIAMHKFSEIYGERDIFNKYIVGLALGVISLVVFFALGFGSLFSALSASVLSSNILFGIVGLGFGFILGAILSYILWIISGYYYKKAYKTLGTKTGQKLFAIGGLLLFVGHILIILVGLGYLIDLLGLILITISYFTLPSEVEVS